MTYPDYCRHEGYEFTPYIQCSKVCPHEPINREVSMFTVEDINEAAGEMLDDLIREFKNRPMHYSINRDEYVKRSNAIHQWRNELIEAIS